MGTITKEVGRGRPHINGFLYRKGNGEGGGRSMNVCIICEQSSKASKYTRKEMELNEYTTFVIAVR